MARSTAGVTSQAEQMSTPAVDDPGPQADARLAVTLGRAADLLNSITATLEPGTVSGTDAVNLYQQSVRVERLAHALKALLAGRIDSSGIWRRSEHRTAAAFIAWLDGVGVGEARSLLDTAEALNELPAVEEALRDGRMSGAQTREIADAARTAPAQQESLIDQAAEGSMTALRNRCRDLKATHAGKDPRATHRRIHNSRHFRHWTDAEGAFCYGGRDVPEVGAAILAAIADQMKRMRTAERGPGTGTEAPTRTTYAALEADAVAALITSGRASTGDASGNDGSSGPGTMIHVRIDLDALRRGHAEEGEVSTIEGVGPIPVPGVRALLDDASVRCIFHKAGDIRAVAHLGRTISAALRTALVERDRCCVVPGCSVSTGLEIDHTIPLFEGGPTCLSNLARLCHWHHYLKTYDGWTLRRTNADDEAEPTWVFEPPWSANHRGPGRQQGGPPPPEPDADAASQRQPRGAARLTAPARAAPTLWSA